MPTLYRSLQIVGSAFVIDITYLTLSLLELTNIPLHLSVEGNTIVYHYYTVKEGMIVCEVLIQTC